MTDAHTATVSARANLLGEHTDYNDGFVLPTLLDRSVTVRIERIEGEAAILTSREVDGVRERPPPWRAIHDWSDYAVGCLWVLDEAGFPVPGVRIEISGDIPMGAGISSSAALEVATLKAMRELLGLEIDDRTIAFMGRKAETDFVGVPVGIMDQMVCAIGRAGKALLLDTQDLSSRLIPLPETHAVAVLHSGVSHQLKDGGYRQRLEECRAAARLLNVPSLRAVAADDPRIERLPEPLNRRARHVCSENARVLAGAAALDAGDPVTFGLLMIESHASQRDDYDVSVAAVDRLVESAMRHGATGARLTGGGFGGSIVALVENDQLESWLHSVLRDCPQAHAISPAGAAAGS